MTSSAQRAEVTGDSVAETPSVRSRHRQIHAERHLADVAPTGVAAAQDPMMDDCEYGYSCTTNGMPASHWTSV